MDRERTIEISALNIAMHQPHSPDRYVDLFKDAFADRMVFAQGELHRLMLGTLYNTDKWRGVGEISGQIYRFVRIDAKEPWFDTSTGKPAVEEQVESINIPENLSAHLQIFPFVFYPNSHQLWYVAKDRKDSLSPIALEKFFQALFDRIVAQKRYPRVACTAMPQHGVVDEMLAWPKLSKITIQIKRPNADDGYEAERRFMELMEEQNLLSYTEELVANDDESIKPNEVTKRNALAASRNGMVVVQGVKPDGTKGRESTVDKPMRIMRKLHSARDTVMSVLRGASAGT